MESFNNLESFSTFNSTGIYCKSGHLSEQTVQQLAERFCMPVLLYNVITVTLSKSECARLEHAWNVVNLYQYYGVVSSDLLNFVFMFTQLTVFPPVLWHCTGWARLSDTALHFCL